jgi:uncharacterized integral membrane protein
MTVRSVVYVIVALLIGVLALANWALIVQPTQLNLLIMRVQAPLGLIILLIAGIVLIVDIGVHAFSRYSWRRERAELSSELERLRLRADQAEESRVHALRESLERETAALRSQLDRVIVSQADVNARLDALAPEFQSRSRELRKAPTD